MFSSNSTGLGENCGELDSRTWCAGRCSEEVSENAPPSSVESTEGVEASVKAAVVPKKDSEEPLEMEACLGRRVEEMEFNTPEKDMSATLRCTKREGGRREPPFTDWVGERMSSSRQSWK